MCGSELGVDQCWTVIEGLAGYQTLVWVWYRIFILHKYEDDAISRVY